MADFELNLRQHYESQKLPDERVRAILVAGRAVAQTRALRRRWWLSAAAVLVVGLGLAIGARALRRENLPHIAAPDAAAAVLAHFAQPGYTMAQVSADRATLEQWLRDNGGPARLDVPVAMRGLQTFGCQVLDVRGQKVFLVCFFLDSAPVAPGGMTLKQEMVVTAPDGTMMKKNRPLVHLVVAPRGAFRDVPAPGVRVKLPASGEWNFETWSSGDLVYVAGAAASAERVAELARAL